jgi:peptide/nickel transport system substrate-binding protein/oligopeptide transport system substrate-binding protein
MLIPWRNLYSEMLIPGSSLVPPIPDYPEARGITRQNAQEAMNILEAQGYPGGKGLPPIIIRSPLEEGSDIVAMMIKNAWAACLDTDVIIDTVPFPGYYDSLKNDDFTLGTITWVGDYADPLSFLQMWETGNSLNDAGFSDPSFDRKLQEAAEMGRVERYQRLSDAETQLLQTGQVLPFEHFPAVNMIDLRFIGGWHTNALDLHPFKYIFYRNEYEIPGTI